MNKLEKLNKQIWKESKPASRYPRDYLVIPALDVSFYETRNSLKTILCIWSKPK